MADVIFDQAALDELFTSVDGPVAKEIARRSIKVQRRAKQLAPVDTGRLRSSIAMELGRDDEGLYGKIGSNVEYAAFQEFGTRHMAAHPYLRPALDEVNRS